MIERVLKYSGPSIADLVDKVNELVDAHNHLHGALVRGCPRCSRPLVSAGEGRLSCDCGARFRMLGDGTLVDRFDCPHCGDHAERIDSYCSEVCAQMAENS